MLQKTLYKEHCIRVYIKIFLYKFLYMKNIIFKLLLFTIVDAIAQKSSIKTLDENNKKQELTQNQMHNSLESIYQMQNDKRNEEYYDWLFRDQKEQIAKHKKQTFIKIGIGILGFVILFTGLWRKNKKTKP